MSELLKKLERVGASAEKDQALLDLISREEIKNLIAQHPNVCAFEHAPDEKEPSKDGDDDEEDQKLTESRMAAR